MKRATVTKGSGNIFRDLGFSEERSAELILKSSLLQALQDTIRGRAWKQVEAAVRLGIDQAKVSKLLAGQMAGFSVERLVHFLSLLGQGVEVTVFRLHAILCFPIFVCRSYIPPSPAMTCSLEHPKAS